MFPDYKLPDPRAGQPVSAHEIANLSKAVKALQPSVGWGMRIAKTSQGVMYALDKSVVQKAVKSKMPFDCSLLEQTGDSSAITVKVLPGKFFYGFGGELADIPATRLQGDGCWHVGVTVGNGATIGIVAGEAEYEGLPENFWVSTIPSSPSKAESGATKAWVDINGLNYYPILRFVKEADGGSYEGPVAFTVKTADGTYAAVQSHHGDVLYSFSGGEAFVGEVVSGGSGTEYGVKIITDPDIEGGTLYVVELNGESTIPVGSRVIGHKVSCVSLPSGNTDQE